ncbi:MAG: hypothetical protein GY776_19490 [Alteromonas sp.]|nr:hypothetical protein [Alteromonas sp.]
MDNKTTVKSDLVQIKAVVTRLQNNVKVQGEEHRKALTHLAQLSESLAKLDALRLTGNK